MHLVDALSAMDAKTFERLCRRRGLDIDERKRVSAAEQAARQLADWARRAALGALPGPAVAVAHYLMTHGAGAERRELGGGALPLLEHDLIFDLAGRAGWVAMPSAFRVQLAPIPGEDRESARALLAMQDEDTWTLLATQRLGRRPVAPAPLYLGDLLERLESPEGLEAQLAELSPKQLRLLEAVEARGHHLETDELLDLERSPARLAISGGATLPPRSASHQLFSRGLLLARGRGLWSVPTEVAERVGAARRGAERTRRRALLAKVTADEDLSPSRATLSEDPGNLAVALLASLAARDALPHGTRAVRRSTLDAVAAEVGAPRQAAELLVALARGAGTRLRGAALEDAGRVLFQTWRNASVWDEARDDADSHRAGEDVVRLATPTRGLRAVLVELLDAVPEERFAPVDEVVQTVARDLRNAGAERLLARANERARSRFALDPRAVVRRIALESLPALGAVDHGVVGGREVLRLSPRARAWERGDAATASAGSRWNGSRLEVGGAARIADVLSAANGAHAIASDAGLALRVDEVSVARALERGLDLDTLRAGLEALASPLDDATARVLVAAARARATVRGFAVSMFLPIEDADLRARIMDDPELREMILASPIEGGILIRAGVPEERLARALDRLGLLLDGST